MSSLQENYGNLHVKEIEFANKLVSHGSADNTNELTIEFANQSADRTLSVPALSANANILTSEADLNATKIDFSNLTAAGTLANADEVIIKSGSSVKKTTISAFRTAIDTTLDINGMTAQTVAGIADDDMLVAYDDSAGDNKKLSVSSLKQINYAGVSGNVAITSAGVASLNITNIGAVHPAVMDRADKVLMSDVSVSNDVKVSTIAGLAPTILDEMTTAGHATSSAGQVSITATGKGAVLSLMSADATCSTAGAVSLADKPSAKKACEANKFLHADANRDVSNINELQATEVQVGADEWKMVVNSSSKNLELKYWNSTASAWQTKFTFNHNV